MKTIFKVEEKEIPKLEITFDDNVESPREWTNLGYFLQKSRGGISPDGQNNAFYRIMVETGDEASSLEEHIDLMKKRIKEETEEKVLAIYPVSMYEHGAVNYSLGQSFGFDYSNNAFYIITNKTAKEFGAKKEDFRKIIADELKIYTQWVNGEVYSFILYNDKGEIEDSCGGFYDIEDIREYLPKEWEKEDLSDYLVYN